MSDPIGRIGQGLASQWAAQIDARRQLGDAGGIPVPFTRPEGAAGASFGDLLTNAINQVSAAQERSSELGAAFLRGEPVELHQVMAAGEESGLALELLVEVRNKFLDAYRTLTNMSS